jgi:uncharacterized membrane protein YoaK (UPF0700 family)
MATETDRTWFERKFERRPSDAEVATPQKPLHQREPQEFAAIIIGGSLLSFNAGFINGVILLLSGFTVSHVTGAVAKSALALGHKHYEESGTIFALLPCFIFGATLSSILIPYSSFHLGRAYNKIFLVGSLFLVLALILHYALPESPAYAYVTSITCGMQVRH